MLAAIVGGKLQGVEAAYLSRKAGWDVLLIDRKPDVPASGLCDSFIQLDVTSAKNLARALHGVDLVIPALENDAALACLERATRDKGIPFVFDPAAYAISASKIKSTQFFHRAGVLTPASWPECRFPVIVKPDIGSGSHGVKVFNDKSALHSALKSSTGQWLIQAFIPGPLYSLEVIGMPGQYLVPQVTDLGIDEGYDCKRVSAPSVLDRTLISDFERTALRLANAINLKGIMDVEVILHENRLHVLEIDARLPSQTPTAVYWSTGVNMIALLAELFLNQRLRAQPDTTRSDSVIYEHVRIRSGMLEIAGEHMLAVPDKLNVYEDFFGANEAITNYAPGRDDWVATLIIAEKNRAAAWQRHKRVIADIRKKFSLKTCRDSVPPDKTGEAESDPIDNC